MPSSYVTVQNNHTVKRDIQTYETQNAYGQKDKNGENRGQKEASSNIHEGKGEKNETKKRIRDVICCTIVVPLLNGKLINRFLFISRPLTFVYRY